MSSSPSPSDGDEEFHESLDRILSSSCSSTSASDDDSGEHRRLLPRFPHPSLDVWLSEPAAERRRRLLHQMDLAADPALSRRRRRPPAADIGRSVSSDALSPRLQPAPDPAIARSRSEGSVDHKPPINPRLPSDGEDEDRRCTIRNLDDGREFVVKEFREDGNRVREVGTGRHLTMEEFEMCVGHSPIVQELMRRQNVADHESRPDDQLRARGADGTVRSKKRGGWLKSIKDAVRNHRELRSSDERDTSSEKGGRRSSSATDDSQDGSNPLNDGPQRVKVRQYGKPQKELSFLYMSQEIQAHSGAIWAIKFSLDGRYLASAGEDCTIHVWRVLEQEGKRELVVERGLEENGSRNSFSSAITNGSLEPALALACFEGNHLEKKRRGGRKSVSSDQLVVPEHVFALSDKPVCSFRGHLEDVLDLSWSKSQYLLSSSMDKTVKLWHMSSDSCLRTFSHSDYVTCIQFNPVDDRYFISGSLDEKVRIWSIPDRQVVDWNDLHEMVTAACYTPDGQGALVGSHKGSCHLYNTSDNKLLQRNQIDLQNKKRKSSSKKVTGLQFAPESSSEVLITSADSRIRVVDGVELVHKFKGFRNTSSQISASLMPNGKHVISASEDSNVYVWRYDADPRPGRSKGSSASVTQSYEHFHCRNVTVAVPWPGRDHHLGLDFRSVLGTGGSVSATWPEENLAIGNGNLSPRGSGSQSGSAWGMVIVTAGRGGEIKAFQNFGAPVRL